MLISALVFSPINALAELPSWYPTEDNLDIRDRLSDPSRNIIDSFDISFFDADNNPVSPDEVVIDSKVKIHFIWSFTNSEALLIEEGDYFSFMLPDTFEVSNVMTGELGEYGYFYIGTDNKVILVFNDEVKAHSVVHGELHFDAKINKAKVTEPGPIVIEKPIEEDSEVTITIQPKGVTNTIEKKGKTDKTLNPNQIEWEIWINKPYATLSEVVVTDILPAGLTLDDVVIKPINLKLSDGSFISYGADLSPSAYTVTDSLTEPNGKDITFNADISKPYAIFLTTTIAESFKPDDGGKVSFQNNATVTSPEFSTSLSTSATIDANYGKLLNKTKPAYNSTSQKFTWTVEYNYGEKLQTNPLLVDVFDADLEYVSGSFKITTKSGTNVTSNYDFTLSNSPANELKIQFNQDVNEAIKLVYETKVKAGILIVEDKTYSNNITTVGKSSSNSGTAIPQLIMKSGTGINYRDLTMDWQIDINVNRYVLKNYTLYDTYQFHESQILDPSSLVVYDVTLNQVVAPDNYDFQKTTAGMGLWEKGFSISFKNDYAETNHQLRVTFTVAFDERYVTEYDYRTFVNNAKLTWDDEYDNPQENNSSASQKINELTYNNGQKEGSYNAVTKEITWTTLVNYKNYEFIDASWVDKIDTDQTYVPESLVVKLYTVNPDGTINLNSTNVDLAELDIQYPAEDNEYQFIIAFPDGSGNNQYSVEFKTTLADTVIDKTEYHNTASVVATSGSTRSLSASVSVMNGNRFVEKSGVQENDLIHWLIYVNQSQSTLHNASLADISSNNQIVLGETLKVYPVIMHPDESFEVDYANPLVEGIDYTVDIKDLENATAPGFYLEFLYTIDSMYVLEYDALINATPDNLNAVNRVVLTGNDETYLDEGGENSFVIDVSAAGGSAVGVKGSLTLEKLDEDGNPMEGVVFELYNPLGRKVATKATDENGIIVFGNLVYGAFTIKEILTLPGFVISDELYLGKVVNVNQDTTDGTVILSLINRKNILSIRKENAAGDLLEGAVFLLEQFIVDEFVTIDTITLTDGTIEIAGLPAGGYRIIELSAPSGYLLNTRPLVFTIATNDYNQALDLEITFVNYRGSVSLTKTDATDNLLAGVVYDLYDNADNLIFSDLITDDVGLITITDTLAPGDYYFIETATVAGNIVDTQPIHFTIVDSADDIPAVVTLSRVNHKATVTFSKVDKAGKPLVGVEFELAVLIDDEYTWLATALSDELGHVTFTELVPGTYRILETATLAGYILNTAPIDFEIPEASGVTEYILELADFINYQGEVIVDKVDDLGKPLAGAVIIILDEAGNTVKEFVSTTGPVVVTDLAPGLYTLKEVTAPTAYKRDETVYSFEIPETFEGDFEAEVITVVNFKLSRLPNTGTIEYGPIAWMLLLSGALFLLLNRKRKIHQ